MTARQASRTLLAMLLMALAGPAPAQAGDALATLGRPQQRAIKAFLAKQAKPGTSSAAADSARLADLDADGQPELVLLWTLSFGNAAASSVTVFSASAGRWHDRGSQPLAGLVDGLVVVEREIRIETRQAAPGDPRCCPSRRQLQRLRWQAGQLSAAGV